ncbi:MAG: hypothetical protein IJT16_02220 [Lachnospiraceae bacterium]|nr:hypothetical protein [Lachnospiraceae bacterium]
MAIEWGVLGIKETRDKDEITKAYRALLKKTNPEDDPGGFMRLRAVYEEALKYAASTENEAVQENAPLDEWIGRLTEVYNDFKKRTDPEQWRELLSDELCEKLDTKPLVLERLLAFLWDHYYIPQAVWKVLDLHFDLLANREELYLNWHRSFVDQVIVNGITKEENLPYRLFIPGENAGDCDEYRRLYFELLESDAEKAPEILKKMDALSESHPYGTAFRLSRLSSDASALEALENLQASYPDDMTIAYSFLICCQRNGKWEKSEERCRELIEGGASEFTINEFLAESLLEQHKYKEAFDAANSALKVAVNDDLELAYYISLLRAKICDSILEEFKDDIPGEDSDHNMDMAWYCIFASGDHAEDALKYAERVKLDENDPLTYYHLMFSVYGENKQARKVLEYSDLMIDHIDRLPKDDPETDEKTRRLPGIYSGKIEALLQQGKVAELYEVIREALNRFPYDRVLFVNAGRAFCLLKDYESLLETGEKFTQAVPDLGLGWYYLALAHFNYSGDDSRAFEAVNRAIELEPKDASGYILKLRILFRNRALEQVRELLNMLKEEGLEDFPEIAWFEALLLEYDEGDIQSAIEAYHRLYERVREYEGTDVEPFFFNALTERISDIERDEAERALIEGDTRKAQLLYEKLRDGVGLGPYDLLHFHFLRLNGDLDGQIRFIQTRIDLRKENGTNAFWEYSHLALIYGLKGDKKAARSQAAKARICLKEAIESDKANSLIYRICYIWLHAVDEDFALAGQELEKVRSAPLCESCEYTVCKDSFISEMYVEMLSGNFDQAHKLARAGMEKWPEEFDFICNEYQMNHLEV